ncbi:hypothetical protein BC629DRAFT_1590590 [Irpex lacteus]|nr:hypothetical protein BC629DRAFT_1590590 [Irpex lacteus]
MGKRPEHSLCDGKDELTSVRSPSPFDAMQLKQLTSVVENIKDLDDEYVLAIAGRLLSNLSWSRFLNHHGEYGARLNSNQSVYGDDNPSRGPLISLFYLLFFNAPVGHLKSIHNAYTDELIKLDTWKKHLDDLVDNWREYILYSTVLLNANVAFLDISNVTPDDFSQVSTVGQVASFISTITSIGSIIVGLLLVRQHRPSSEMDAADAMESLERYIKRTGSVQKLALLYAVPYAFLMWG